MRAGLRRDSGFSLSELLVVIALMGLVVSGSYALLNLVNIGSAQSSQRAWISREIGQPLEHLERMFSQQQPPLESTPAPGLYIVKIRTDQDRDDLYEYREYEATADGRLVERYSEQLSNLTLVPPVQERVLSQHNANRAAGVPLLRYLDINGATLALNDPKLTVATASVVLTIVTEYDGTRHSDSRQVFCRNR